MKRLLQVLAAIVGFVLLYALRPFVNVRVGLIPSERLGHLAANTDLFLRRRKLGLVPADRKYVFLVDRNSVANRQLLLMFRRVITIVENPLLRMFLIQQIRFKTRFCQELPLLSNEYDEFARGTTSLIFTSEEEARGREGLRRLGIGESAWHVCIFARDSAFLGTKFSGLDWSYHDYRNCDINTFNLAIEQIVARGGHVVRVGHIVNAPLEMRHPRVIDYATQSRNEFMDVYLVAKSRFFLGSAAGIGEMAAAFDVPRCGVNWTPVWTFPLGKNNLYIPKKIRSKTTGALVPFYKMIGPTKNRDAPLVLDGNAFTKAGFEYVDNSPEEIRDVVIEMIDRMDGQRIKSSNTLMERYFNLLPRDHWSHGARVPIGEAFLRQNSHLFFDDSIFQATREQ
jgi:putative glycosyltransferase (TIGR04372 family)